MGSHTEASDRANQLEWLPDVNGFLSFERTWRIIPDSKWLGWAPHLQAMKFGHLEGE